jgi:hypothetical protein
MEDAMDIRRLEDLHLHVLQDGSRAQNQILKRARPAIDGTLAERTVNITAAE